MTDLAISLLDGIQHGSLLRDKLALLSWCDLVEEATGGNPTDRTTLVRAMLDRRPGWKKILLQQGGRIIAGALPDCREVEIRLASQFRPGFVTTRTLVATLAGQPTYIRGARAFGQPTYIRGARAFGVTHIEEREPVLLAEFYRGFLVKVGCSATLWMRYADFLVQGEAIRTVGLHGNVGGLISWMDYHNYTGLMGRKAVISREEFLTLGPIEDVFVLLCQREWPAIAFSYSSASSSPF